MATSLSADVCTSPRRQRQGGFPCCVIDANYFTTRIVILYKPEIRGGSAIHRRESRHRFAFWLLGELSGVVLLVAFVVAMATMPPLKVAKQPGNWTNYRISIDAPAWQKSAQTYWDTIRDGSLGLDRKNKPIGPMIASRFKSSLILLISAAVLAVGLGVLKGIRDFNTMRTGRSRMGPALTSAVQGIPDFWLIVTIQLIAIGLFNWVGWRPFRIVYQSEHPINSLILPVFCLALIPGSYVARITSRALTTVWEREYIRTAFAKGLTETRVLFRHALRNAAVQILDGLPNIASIMVANLLIVEYMFRYPGLTTKLQESIPSFASAGPQAPADVPVVAAAGFCLGLTFSLLHLVVNAARRLADPRLKERGTA